MKARTGRKVKFLNATGVSDGRYYADDGIEIINFGPGSGAQGHAANESVPIGGMVEAAKIQLDVVRRLLGKGRVRPPSGASSHLPPHAPQKAL